MPADRRKRPDADHTDAGDPDDGRFADSEGVDPEATGTDALWDRLVERGKAAPAARGKPRTRRPLSDDETAIDDLMRELAAMGAAVLALRSEVQALSRRIFQGEINVALDVDQATAIIEKVLSEMTFDMPTLADGQPVRLRLRLKAPTPSAGRGPVRGPGPGGLPRP